MNIIGGGGIILLITVTHYGVNKTDSSNALELVGFEKEANVGYTEEKRKGSNWCEKAAEHC